jgi:signal transduction histidine kinase
MYGFSDGTAGFGRIIYVVFEDRAGAIWAGGEHGLSRFDGRRFVTLGLGARFREGAVRALCDDAAGNLWIGTNNGLYRLREGRLDEFPINQTGAPERALSLFSDSRGILWLGTVGGGLYSLHEGRLVKIPLSDPMSEALVTGIIDDDQGRLWMGSNLGVFWGWRADLEKACGAGAKQVAITRYGRDDGLTSVECSGGSQPTVCKSKDGQLWFSTVKGVVKVNPAELARNTNQPPVWIEAITLDEETQTLLPKNAAAGSAAPAAAAYVPAICQPGTRRIEFRYAGLSFLAPEKVRFKHRLDGFDPDWVDDGGQRVAKYTRLPPGSYTFHVRAANNDGVWNEAGATLSLVVLPYFWETWWFRILCGLLAAGLLAAAYRRRVALFERRRLEQEAFARQLMDSQEAERKRIAHELHDSLGQNLLLIRQEAMLGLNEIEPSNPFSKKMAAIGKISSAAIQEVRQIAHDLRPPQFDQIGLTAALRAMVEKVARTSSLELSGKIESVDGLFSPRDEINLYRIVQEALNNIVKHAGAKMIRVDLRQDIHAVELLVLDDGKGFECAKPRAGSEGMGLAGIGERVRLLGGHLTIEARPGAGCKLQIEIPVAGERLVTTDGTKDKSVDRG